MKLTELVSAEPLVSVQLKDFGGAPAGAPEVPFELEPQRAKNWCWAAVAVSVERFFQRNALTQCLLAQIFLHTDGCCAGQIPESCDKPNSLRDVLEGLHSCREYREDALAGQDLIAEITGGSPVCCHISWRGTSAGHFIVIVGVDENDDGLDVLVKDPYPVDLGRRWNGPYDELRDRYDQTGTWDYSYKVK